MFKVINPRTPLLEQVDRTIRGAADEARKAMTDSDAVGRFVDQVMAGLETKVSADFVRRLIKGRIWLAQLDDDQLEGLR